MPHFICVTGFVCQSEPTVAILLAGHDCGIPPAPLSGLIAKWLNPDSHDQSSNNAVHSLPVHPCCLASSCPRLALATLMVFQLPCLGEPQKTRDGFSGSGLTGSMATTGFTVCNGTCTDSAAVDFACSINTSASTL